MPELPEVETMRRAILPAVGRRIVAVVAPRTGLRPIIIQPHLPQLRRRLQGRTIRGIGRCGKRLVLELDDTDRLVIEPRMTGLVLPDEPPDRAHVRLVIRLAGEQTAKHRVQDGSRAVCSIYYWDQRGLGAVRLLSLPQFRQLFGSGRIGPDALEISARELQQRLGHSRRQIKVALMDQQAVAGIGNIYASEILHRAGVHPAVPCCRLDDGQWGAILKAMRSILRQAIRCGGSTLRDGTYRRSGRQQGGFQQRHQVYDREGQLCLRCRQARIVRFVQAQRSTYFCPNCQK